MLLIVSGKNRHIKETEKTIDSFRIEVSGQGCVDFQLHHIIIGTFCLKHCFLSVLIALKLSGVATDDGA